MMMGAASWSPLEADAETAPVEITTTTILAKIQEFDDKITRSTFRFEEEFLLVATGEREKLTGKVYFDRPGQRARLDYSGKVKYKVWIDRERIYFYDHSLEQVVIREWDDFMKLHFQAFLDLPILFDMGRFQEKYVFSVDTSSPAAGSFWGGSKARNPALVYLKARPRGSQSLYELLIGVDRETGQPKTMELILENYRARLEIKDFNSKAKFSDTIFDKKFPEGVAVLDLTKKQGVIP